MLRGIPTNADYLATAKILHKDAWPQIADVLWHEMMDKSQIWFTPDVESEEREREKESAKLSMLSAVIVAFTGFEHLLRAEVVKNNPYLLIVRHPKEWAGSGKDFSEVNSIEAEHLPQLVNEVSGNSLSPALIDKYQAVRKLRNRAVHSHDGLDPKAAAKVGRLLLELYAWSSHRKCGWLDLLREDDGRLKNWAGLHPDSSAVYDEFHQRLKNFACVEALCTSAAERATFLGLFRNHGKASRRYLCPGCNMDWKDLSYYHWKPEPSVRPAQLLCGPDGWRPLLHCHSCQFDWPVSRRKCTTPSCKGDVIIDSADAMWQVLFRSIGWDGEYVCMTCGRGQDDRPPAARR